MSEPAAAENATEKPKVVIVGGGLAGLATAVALAWRDLQIELLEAKQSLGGRAGSYRDHESNGLIDHCQHVAMGCCTNFLDLCERTGCSDLLERHRRLHFFSADGQRSDFEPSRWLPAPLHLLQALMGLKHLGWRDKLGIMWAMLSLMRMTVKAKAAELSVGTWLQMQRQTSAAIERFWKVVLVSALGESLERSSLSAARKVFVDGFLAHSHAADVLIPNVSLSELYDQRIAGWLGERGVTIRLGEAVRQIAAHERGGVVLQTAETQIIAQAVVVAVPWRRLSELLNASLQAAVPKLKDLENLESSPITSLHLWTDRPITTLPHAVLIDRLSQWVFARNIAPVDKRHYYQVVISASRELAGRSKQSVIDEVWQDLQAIFPAARHARLLDSQLITQRDAVFSVTPTSESLRLPQQTLHPALVLAGDWTDTGWPATMEGAVRSGYLAAEQVLQNLSIATNGQRILQPDLPRGWLARLLIR